MLMTKQGNRNQLKKRLKLIYRYKLDMKKLQEVLALQITLKYDLQFVLKDHQKLRLQIYLVIECSVVTLNFVIIVQLFIL